MFAATGIKVRFAGGAGIIGSHVISDGQLITTDSTENCFLVKLCLGPNLMFVIGFFFMATEAGIIFVTAFEFDGYDIQFGMPMHATCLIVYRLSKDIDATDLIDFEWFQNFFLRKRETRQRKK